MTSESDANWEQPQRRRRHRGVWLAAGVALVVVVGLLVGTPEEDDAIPVDERDDAASPGRHAPPLADTGRWTAYPDLDNTQALAPDPDGGMWVGTGAAGLLRWEPGAGEPHRLRLPDELAGRHIRSVAAAGDGAVWAVVTSWGPAVEHDELVRVEDGEWTRDTGLPPNRELQAVAVDHAGAVWVASDRGVHRFDGGRWRRFDELDGLPRAQVTDLAVGGDGAVWAVAREWGSSDGAAGGIARFDDGEWTGWTTDGELPHDVVVALGAGPDGRVWAITERMVVPGAEADDEVGADADPSLPSRHAQSLLRVAGDGWTTEAIGEAWTAEAAGDGSPLRKVTDMVVDDAGVPWVAFRRYSTSGEPHGGVARFDGDRWTVVDGLGGASSSRRPGAQVRSLAVDASGALWAATAGGAVRRQRGRWHSYASGQGPAGDVISSVAAADGVVWTAGEHGVARFDGDRWDRWTADDGLGDDHVHDIAVDGDGAVWAATRGGVSRYAGGEWTTWTAEDGLGFEQATSVAVGDDGAVWAAVGEVGEGGLARFDGRRWTNWRTDGPLADAWPWEVAAGAGADVWMPLVGGPGGSGSPGGLARFDGERWEVVTSRDGLPTDRVSSVAVDPAGLVWVGTSRGVARFDGRRWVDADSDGNPLDLPTGEPAAHATITAIIAGPDGVLWVASLEGLSRFDGWEWTTASADELLPVRARGIAVDGDAVWVGTWAGLWRFDARR